MNSAAAADAAAVPMLFFALPRVFTVAVLLY